MAALDHTRALMAALAGVIGLPDLPQDASGGYQLSIGDDNDVFVYGGDDVSILVVVPLAKLPEHPSFALVNYLLKSNMFNADMAPFVIAADEGGMLIMWGKLRIDDFDGTSLARTLDNLAERASQIRADIEAEG